ncbi:MAG: hypothetical protein U1F23_11225 [Lysobacterales bacterium]
MLTEVRRIRSEMNIAPGKTIPLLFADGDATSPPRRKVCGANRVFLARSGTPRWLDAGAGEPAAAAAVVGTLRVLIPLAGLIDVDAEKARLGRKSSDSKARSRNRPPSFSPPSASARPPRSGSGTHAARGLNVKLDALRDQAARLGSQLPDRDPGTRAPRSGSPHACR